MPHVGKGVYAQYDPTKFADAIEAVREGMSVRKAAKAYGVPRSTLSDRITGRVSEDAVLGKSPVIPVDIEKEMASRAMDLAEKGFGIGRKQMIARAGTLCRQMGVKTSSKSGLPGKDWFKGFKRRNPALVLRKAEKLSTVRSRMLNPVTTGKYMLDLRHTIYNDSLPPTSIWNMDETGINLEHQPTRVLARQGTKTVPGRTGNTRENITFLPCINAAGDKMPPMIIGKGKTERSLRAFNMHEGPSGALWKFQEKAWMDDRLGVEWFLEVFLRNCGEARPQLLILDSHHSHETLSLLQLASENKIHVLAIPPHTTHYLCPLDRCLFGPLQREYNYKCTEYMSSSATAMVNKLSFPKLINAAYEKTFTRTNIVSGFESTGIVGWDPLRIPKEAFKPSSPFDKAAESTEQTIDIRPDDPHPLQWVLRQVEEQTAAVSLVTEESSVFGAEPEQLVSLPLDVYAVPEFAAELELPAEINSVQTLAMTSISAHVPAFMATQSDPVLTSRTLEDIDAANVLSSLTDGTLAVEIVSPDQSDWSCNWNLELDSIFNLSPPDVPEKKNTKRKVITSHRLLTGPGIIEEKIKEKQEKEKKEASKAARLEAKRIKVEKNNTK
ncbi:MAG: helix-turn-helix domain-containing protein [Candidatus Thiodiazotropha sp.]